MGIDILFKKIHDSIDYGLSTEKGGIGGALLNIYTLCLVVFTIAVVSVSLVGAILGPIYSKMSFEEAVLMGVVPITFFILPLYLPIYYIWYKDMKNVKKQNVKSNVSNNLQSVSKPNTSSQKLIKNKQLTSTDDSTSDLSIHRETEFYQGFIRFKMSVTNNSSFVVNDVALDFDYDNNLLRIDRQEPDYQIKNGRTIFGNISANSSKTVAVYFDPMMCSKGADINCQINYKDAKGQPQTTHMKPKKISVVCPIMETESDINIGRLKEFIEKLPYRDSKVYQVQNGFDIDVLKNVSREIVQKHDVKYIRTLFTKDRSTCEIWYYGKTKVYSHDIVIKITILSETQSIELFAATETVESLAGLLAEVGRELKSAIKSKVTGNVQQVINVSIKDSIVQRSNLLSYCDVNGNCSGDVVIEDSLVQRSEIGFDAEVKDSLMQKTNVGGNSCPACGKVLAEGAKFCMECGGKLI